MFLREIGHEMVGRCQTGRDALEMCRTHAPEVVLMDIHLEGDWDGIQTAEKITREFNIPVIFISSDTDSQVVGRAIESNSYGYLLKPIVKKELAIGIDLAYYKHQADMELKQREKGFRQFISDSPLPIMIVNSGRVQYVNNKALALLRSHYIEDVMGLPFEKFVSGKLESGFEELIGSKSCIPANMPVFNLVMKDVHSNPIYAEVQVSAVEFNNRKSVQIIIRDIQSGLRSQIKSDALSLLAGKDSGAFFLVDNDGSVCLNSSSITWLQQETAKPGKLFNAGALLFACRDGKEMSLNELKEAVAGQCLSVSVKKDGISMGTYNVYECTTSIGSYSGLLFTECGE
jgi:PAS domain S-box-containing protein